MDETGKTHWIDGSMKIDVPDWEIKKSSRWKNKDTSPVDVQKEIFRTGVIVYHYN